MSINPVSFWEQLNTKHRLSNNVVDSKITFPNSSTSSPSIIENIAFNNVVEFLAYNGSVSFKNCAFYKEIIITSNSSSTIIELIDCEFESLKCKEEAPIKSLTIQNDPNKKNNTSSSIDFRGSDLTVNNCNNIDLLDFNANSCSINGSNIKTIKGNRKGSFIKIKDSFVNKSIFSGWRSNIEFRNGVFIKLDFENCNARVDIQDCLITDISFNKCSYNEIFIIKNTSILHCLSLIDSKIDGGSFKNCDFSSALMVVEDTNLFNLEFDAVLWNSDDFLLDKTKSEEFERRKISQKNYQRAVIREHLRIQHIYRHIKQSADKANDRINYQKFKAFELDRYMRTLQFRKNWALKINLCFGRYSNFFGLWWLAPIGYYIVSTLFFYFLLARFPGHVFLQKPFTLIFADLARFANPTHLLENIVFMKHSNGWVILLDYISRIFQGLLGYQTIMGFRKSFF